MLKFNKCKGVMAIGLLLIYLRHGAIAECESFSQTALFKKPTLEENDKQYG